MAIKKGLGKGLSALLGDVEQEFSAREEKPVIPEVTFIR